MEAGIDAILASALAEGRSNLFEHEVYAVLSALGLEVPRYLFVKDIREVTSDALAGFGHTIVAKIVSTGIPHKSRVGGVRKAASADPLFVQFVLAKMKEEVLSHFPMSALDDPGDEAEQPQVSGFLLVDYVPHTQALGYEVLIGFRADPAFGPVLTVSKGGDDAEFFAAHYDPANLFLPPMDFPEALALMNSLHIRHKFESVGHPEYLEKMAKAVAAMSALACGYSSVASSPRFIFDSFEVNPFAISKDHRLVAIDGLAVFHPASERDAWAPGARVENLEYFYRPRGIAVIGVSADLAKYSLGRDIAALLHDLKRDDLFLVNPKGGKIEFGKTGYPLYRSLAELPGAVDLAVYAAPAQNAAEFFSSLAGSGVKVVILIPGIPASMDYADYAREIGSAVPKGVRVLGPNCMGVFWAPPGLPASGALGHPWPGAPSGLPRASARSATRGTGAPHGINTLFIDEKRLEVRASARANAALLTQSGALAVTALDKLRNCSPFRAVTSFGNKFDVNISDLLAFFESDPGIGVIALYVEGFAPGEGRRFFEIASSMATPIVAYKGGRTEAGARSAASHTASMSGSYEVFSSACRQAGVILAQTIEEYYDLVRTFSLLALRPPAGNRVAGVVNAGFESTVGADELKGLRQAILSEATRKRLNEINRSGLVDTSTPFLDITPMADDRMYADYVEAVMKDPGVDCVFVAVVPHAVTLKTVPETCRNADALAPLLVSLAGRYGKPMVVSVNAGRHYADFVSVLEEGGLPVYSDIRSAISSLDTFVSFGLKRKRKQGSAC
jgi:3-hydroxypropionyl-CoA synthetase (ADP-forming)